MKDGSRKKILLVGSPNVGKSVVFSFLTGRYAVVSNYPGTTVEVSTGAAVFDKNLEVIDTPGVNSLFPKSEDERVTRDILLRNRDATVVQVADSKNLFRALMLTAQLAELGLGLVLVLNMKDEARQRGISIDARRLSSLLGVDVIETVATEKVGLSELVGALSGDAARVPRIEVRYPAPIAKVIDEAGRTLGEERGLGLFEILTMMSGEREPEMPGTGSEGRLTELLTTLDTRAKRLPQPYSFYIASGRRETVDNLVRLVEVKDRLGAVMRGRDYRSFAYPLGFALTTLLLYLLAGRNSLSAAGLDPTLILLTCVVTGVSLAGAERIDRLSLHPIYGMLMLALVVYLVYMLVGVFAAQLIVGRLESGLFDGFLIPAVGRAGAPQWLDDFLVGDYGLVSMGLKYAISIVLPIVAVFFFVFGILEDTGYFPRLTVLTNRTFKISGLNGRATLPVVLGFGCVTMAILASRILETRKERIIVVTLLSLAVPCSAQLGIILALISAISTKAVILISLVIIGEFFVVGRALSAILRGGTSDFILELPPMRIPKISNILLKTWTRVKWFLREALPYFIVATALLYLLDITGGIRVVHRLVEPVTSRLLGLPVETAEIVIVGFFRRDYGAAGLYRLWREGLLVGNQVVVALVLMSLFLPCLASLIVMVKELGLRYALAILSLVTVLSVLSAGVLNLVLQGLGIQL